MTQPPFPPNPHQPQGQFPQVPQQPYQQAQFRHQAHGQHHAGGAPLPPPGFLAITLQGSVMTSSMVVPTVLVDGRPVPVDYGTRIIPVVPGRHMVEVHTSWMRQFGQASLAVDVAPGQHVPVYYRAPYHQFTTGSIGHVPQQGKGLWVMVTVLTLVVALVIGVPVLAALLMS